MLVRAKQCAACPWRTDVVPARDIPGGYCETKHAALRSTLVDPADPVRSLTSPAMACHETTAGREMACTGWVANQLEAGHLGLRVLDARGALPPIKLVGPQRATLDETLEANSMERGPGKSAPFVAHSDTSRAAAASMKPHLGRVARRVYDEIARRGADGATDDEIEEALDLTHQTASARRRELVQLDSVVDSGRRRATRRGRSAVVWIAAEDDARKKTGRARDAAIELRAAKLAHAAAKEACVDALRAYCEKGPDDGDELGAMIEAYGVEDNARERVKAAQLAVDAAGRRR